MINRRGRAVLFVGIGLVVMMLLFPPWNGYNPSSIRPPVEVFWGYYFIFSPPPDASMIDGCLLLSQLFAVLLGTAVLAKWLNRSKR
jgi:hypothetical protein